MSAHTADLAIGGMTCAACAGRVEAALRAVPGVATADVDVMLARARVQHDGTVRDSALAQAVAAVGYTAAAAGGGDGPRAAAGTGGPSLWVLALCALLTLPFLFQMAMMALGFAWVIPPALQVALALPVQVIGGARFYAGAARAIGRGLADMDLLVALGSTAAFGLSLWLMQKGSHGHDLYFEASCAIVTMVLLGKWLEARARGQATEAIRGLMSLAPETARRESGGSYETVPVRALRPGDVIFAGAGERVAADGEVLAGESEIDVALLTGESAPVAVRPGSRVAAGSLNGLSALRIQVAAAGANSQLGRMIESVSRAQIAKGQTGRMVDRISAIFVPVVMALAVAAFAAWMALGAAWVPALEHAIAVLVIACPCALGLAAPAALVAGAGASARAGILLRDLDAVEAAHGITLVALDKTGTLTQGRPKVTAAAPAQGSAERLVALAAAAQAGATHPLAVGLAEAAASARTAHPAADAARAVPGQGVVAQFGAKRVLVGNRKLLEGEGIAVTALESQTAHWRSDGATVVYVAEDGAATGAIALADELRPEAREAVARLKAAGYRVVMLSGDAPETVARVAAQIGLDEAHGAMAPDGKAQYLRDRKHAGERAAFVGDGVNDAPALAEAALGVAVAGAADVAGQAAAITILKPDLRLVAPALDIAGRTRTKIRQNLFWAFVYNLVGLPLAALGWLTPSVAGAAMALSSVSVVSNASRLSAWRPEAGLPSLALAVLRWALILGLFVPAGLTLLYAIAPPPATILMLGRMAEGEGWDYRWTPLDRISPNLVRAVIASEDQGFCRHAGFAWDEIDAAVRQAERDGGPVRGASSISQQTAKNVFLWPGRSYLRKGVEAYFTVLIEALWSKRRIMEVYLNVAEMGPGVYGAEAAARHWFQKAAKDLTAREAAALAAILPSPRRYRAAQPGGYIAGRIGTIAARAASVGRNGMADCVLRP